MSEHPDPPLVTVGRFAEMVKLSPKMLRTYDRMGLLEPAWVDPRTAYRYYHLDQVRRAELIRLLRDLDMPLAEISALLTEPDSAEIEDHLREHRRRMQVRLREAARIVARLDRALDGGGGLMRYDVALEERAPLPVVSRRRHAPPEGLDPTIAALTEELLALLAGRGLHPAAREIVLYHNGIERSRGHDVEVCIPLRPDDADLVPDSWRLPGGVVATTLHHGPWEDIRAAYVVVFAWIVENELRKVGPVREEYLVDERDTGDALDYVTKISWPVEP